MNFFDESEKHCNRIECSPSSIQTCSTQLRLTQKFAFIKKSTISTQSLWKLGQNAVLMSSEHRWTVYGRSKELTVMALENKRASHHNRWGVPVFIAAMLLRSRTTTVISFSQGSDVVLLVLLIDYYSGSQIVLTDYPDPPFWDILENEITFA